MTFKLRKSFRSWTSINTGGRDRFWERTAGIAFNGNLGNLLESAEKIKKIDVLIDLHQLILKQWTIVSRANNGLFCINIHSQQKRIIKDYSIERTLQPFLTLVYDTTMNSLYIPFLCDKQSQWFGFAIGREIKMTSLNTRTVGLFFYLCHHEQSTVDNIEMELIWI